jgi:hypothetical protein
MTVVSTILRKNQTCQGKTKKINIWITKKTLINKVNTAIPTIYKNYFRSPESANKASFAFAFLLAS